MKEKIYLIVPLGNKNKMKMMTGCHHIFPSFQRKLSTNFGLDYYMSFSILFVIIA
jgi:hypothetical protein